MSNETAGGSSSSLMVRVWVTLGSKVALTGLSRVTRTVSLISSSSSLVRVTPISLDVSPGLNVNVPGVSR